MWPQRSHLFSKHNDLKAKFFLSFSLSLSLYSPFRCACETRKKTVKESFITALGGEMFWLLVHITVNVALYFCDLVWWEWDSDTDSCSKKDHLDVSGLPGGIHAWWASLASKCSFSSNSNQLSGRLLLGQLNMGPRVSQRTVWLCHLVLSRQ